MRLNCGRPGRTVAVMFAECDKGCHWPRYCESSKAFPAFSTPEAVLSSEGMSEKAHEERMDGGWVGDRAGTISRKCMSSQAKLEKGEVGGEQSCCFIVSLLRQLSEAESVQAAATLVWVKGDNGIPLGAVED